MAATVRFVKPEHVETLIEYLTDEGVALVFPDAQKKAEEEGIQDGDELDYDFGGDADVFVEKVFGGDHYLLNREN